VNYRKPCNPKKTSISGMQFKASPYIYPQIKKVRRFYIFLLLVWFCQFALSGINITDSLRQMFSEATHDSIRVKVLFGLGNRFVDGPSDSLLFYYHHSLLLLDKNIAALSEQSSHDSGGAMKSFKQLRLRALIEIGIEYFFRSEYDKALDYYFDAAEVAKELNDRSHLSECYGEIGILYKNQGRYDTALIYQQKALEIALTLDEPDWVAICNNNIGNIYKARGFFTIALDYFLKALKTFEEMNQPRRVAACMHSVGDLLFQQENHEKALVYFEKTLELARSQGDRLREANMLMAIGNVKYAEKFPEAARRNYLRALGIFDSLGYSHNLDDCYRWIGNTFLAQSNIALAEKYYLETLEFSEQEDDQSGRAETLNRLAEVYLLKHDLENAYLSANQSLELAQRLGTPTIAMAARHNLYRIDTANGRHLSAMRNFIVYTSIRDSLFRAGQFRVITEMEYKYDTEKKEQNIALLTEQNKVQELVISRRNRLLWSASAILIFVIVGGYFYYQNRRLKAVQQASELENRLLRAQMNPHFIFNSLIAIQGFIYEKKPVEAGDFLAKFADLVRLTLENSRSEFVLLQKEIGMLQVYLELQQLRFDHKFDFRVTVDDDIDPQAIKIPPMLAQPFIENAVEHGIRRKADIGFIKVLFKRVNENLQVIVEDDGIGRDAAMKFRKKDKPQSLAISITRDRLKVLSKKHKEKFDFQIHDLFDEKNQPCGTRVKFAMPVEEG
jgi:tetratricopeptide (TPR) repeat protein